MRQRFRFPLTDEQMCDLLTASYQAEVEYRHRHFVGDEEISKEIKQMAHFLTSPASKFGALLCGLCGNGKTTMLYAVRAAISFAADCGAWSIEQKYPVLKIANAVSITQSAKDCNLYEENKKSLLLAIDDLGREPVEVVDYGNITNPIIELLEYRYEEQLFTLISTNLKASDISTKYGKRIADRFNEMFEVLVFRNNTYRKLQ